MKIASALNRSFLLMRINGIHVLIRPKLNRNMLFNLANHRRNCDGTRLVIQWPVQSFDGTYNSPRW
ncbi:hypothetical protein D3C81_1826850 [compost metagenome]